VEFSWVPNQYEKDEWGGELRPILAWEDDHWLAAVNPILGLPLSGPDVSAGPTFEPAAKVARKVGEVFAFGVEYYGSLGAISAPLPIADQHHLFFGVFDVRALPKVDVNLGLGGGVTAASANLVGKAIVGYTFGEIR
jgi:hypothetical protein